MKKNYFTHDQVSKLKSLVGQKLDGFFLDGKMLSYSYIYQTVIATERSVLHFTTEMAREGVEQRQYEEINVWEVNAATDGKLDFDFDHKTTWFEGEVIREIKIVRSNYSQFLGEGSGIQYEVDTAIIFYLESGMITLWMEGVDQYLCLSLAKFDGFDGYEIPLSGGYMFSDDDDEDSNVVRWKKIARLITLDEAFNTTANFRRGLKRSFHSYLSSDELHQLHSLLGKRISKISPFVDSDLGVRHGLRFDLEAESVYLVSTEHQRWFLEGPWDGQQHFSQFEVYTNESLKDRQHIAEYINSLSLSATPLTTFEGERLTRIDVIDEIMSGNFFDDRYKLVSGEGEIPRVHMQHYIDTLRWEYGSCIALVLHFETGSVVVSRTCMHNFQIHLDFVKHSDRTTIHSLKARFADLKVEIHSDTRRMFTMKAGPWAGPGEPVDLNWVSDEAMLAKGCTLKCYEQDAVSDIR